MSRRFADNKLRNATRRPTCEPLEQRGLLSVAGAASALPDFGANDREAQAIANAQTASVVSMDYQGQIGDLIIRAQAISSATDTDGPGPVVANAAGDGNENGNKAVEQPAAAPSTNAIPPATAINETNSPVAVEEPISLPDAGLPSLTATSEIAQTTIAMSDVPTASIAPKASSPLGGLLQNPTVQSFPASVSTPAPNPTPNPAPAPAPVPVPKGAAALFQQIFKGHHTIQGRWAPVLKLFDADKTPDVRTWKARIADSPSPMSDP